MKPPSPNRLIAKTPFEAVTAFLKLRTDEVEKYRQSLQTKEILQRIDENIKLNIPMKRYDKIKGFKNNIDWINILETLYVLIRIKRPEILVETGIGEIGMSTAFILEALSENNFGHLYSIDPDKFYSVYGFHSGAGVADKLRVRHTFVKGYSQQSLLPLLDQIGKLDFFLHDGDHSFRTKEFEFEIAFNYMSKGGCLLSDDTFDSAFDIVVGSKSTNAVSVRYGDQGFFSYSQKL